MLSPEQAKENNKEAFEDNQQYQSNHQSGYHTRPVIDLSCRRFSGKEEDAFLQFQPLHDKSEERDKSWYGQDNCSNLANQWQDGTARVVL